MIRKSVKKIPGTTIVWRFLRILIYKISFQIIRLFIGIDRKKVVFESFDGRSYSCNPRAISEKLYNRNSKMKIIWLFNKPSEFEDIIPDYIIPVKRNSLRGIYELYTAKVWVDNFQKPHYLNKRKE